MPDSANPDDEMSPARRRPVILCVLDGWGAGAPGPDNAIAQARTPILDRLADTWPTSHLRACGAEVGLPAGQMGNSEVGHMNLGAGRAVLQSLPLIDDAMAKGQLSRIPALSDLIATLKSSGGVCHMLGLVSPGGVHSHQDHLIALARIITAAGVRVFLHAFLDGRDTPPSSAQGYMKDLLEALRNVSNFKVATVSGRYWAMDRDRRWERVAAAHEVIAMGRGPAASDAPGAIAESYERDETDEFVTPTVIGDYGGMEDGDGVLMFNFRADRAREIMSALVDPDFDGFPRARRLDFAARVGMSEYSSGLNDYLTTLFPARRLENTLGELIAAAGMDQLRIAETEKYAHVTFFFNGGAEPPWDGEERILIPSPKVATYDLKPEMSAFEVTERLEAAIATGKFDFILVNYANGDMVGHTGDMVAAVLAAEAVDTCVGRLAEGVIKAGGILMITADHGNAEMMRDGATGQPHTAHTLSPVPLILVNGPDWARKLTGGVLADVAPTVLGLMELDHPAEMTGQSLIAGRSGDRSQPSRQAHG